MTDSVENAAKFDEGEDANRRDAKTVAQALADAEFDPDDDPYAAVPEDPLQDP